MCYNPSLRGANPASKERLKFNVKKRRAVMQLGSLQLWQLAAANGNCRWA